MMPSTRSMIILLAMIWVVVISSQEDDPKQQTLELKNFTPSLQNQSTRLQDQPKLPLFYLKPSISSNVQKYGAETDAYDKITKASTKHGDVSINSVSKKPSVYDDLSKKSVNKKPAVYNNISKKTTVYYYVSTKPVNTKLTVNDVLSKKPISKKPTVHDAVSTKPTVNEDVGKKLISKKPTVYNDVSTKPTLSTHLYDNFTQESTEYHELNKTYAKVKKPWVSRKLVILFDVKKGSRFLEKNKDYRDTEEDKKIIQDFIRYLIRKEHEDDEILFR